ncbi:MAG: amino acid ABC transporter ATP-binding protein, partial [Candidatus Eisenbacteria bacterium]|nr:amino acid ABC transporter ATP-binding protein [Candidatus Eisenbacteria bacterium]
MSGPTESAGSAARPMVQVDSLRKRFGDQWAVDGVSFVVPASSVTVLIGPSGSGKSTVLRLINGLERMDSGRVLLDGLPLDHDAKNLDRVRADCGMVF